MNTEAKDMYEEAFKGLENNCDMEHPNTIMTLNSLGSPYDAYRVQLTAFIDLLTYVVRSPSLGPNNEIYCEELLTGCVTNC